MGKKSKKIGLFLNKKFDYSILIVTLLLLSIGLIMLLSASAPTSLSESGNSYKYVVKQGALAALGLFAMITLSKIDYRIYKHFKWIRLFEKKCCSISLFSCLFCFSGFHELLLTPLKKNQPCSMPEARGV